MSTLTKMEIIGCSDNKFQNEVEKITLQINPATLSFDKGVSYTKDKRKGIGENGKKFDKFNETSLKIDILLDETGVIPGLPKDSIIEAVNNLEKTVYNINKDTHEPNYLKVSWGSFLFKGRLESLSYDYSLFRPDGSPLRVKISAKINGFMDPITEAKEVGRSSPDLSRIITLKTGESISYWCNEIYGDASYCMDVARYNRLTTFINIPAGTQILFPPIERTNV
jgi:hypothetical protein